LSKVLVIGIDGMDSIQLSKFKEYLPNFHEFMKKSPDIKLKSVFPPDSIPAWGSIYTGRNPAEHGVINFIDPNNEEIKIRFKDIHKYYQGKTFWDIASQNGKRVCILLPYSIYPPWSVNGAMVCRSVDIVKKNFPLKVFPEELFEKFKLDEIEVNLFHGFPSKRNLNSFLKSCKNRTIQEAELGLKFLKNYNADLYFIYFSALDAVQHTFWKYCDENHPDYPGENKYKDVIKDFYHLMDNVLGKLLDSIDNKTTTIILSDHGHGMRPINIVNINEILRRKGFLKSTIQNKKINSPINQKERLKKLLAKTVDLIGIGNFGLKIIDNFPIFKNSLSKIDYMRWNETTAYLSAIAGIKSYSEGGIIINKDSKDNDYEKIREVVISELSEITNPDNGENLMKWICKREEIYDGKHIKKYPDIIFELKSDFGVGWDIHNSIIGKSSMSSFQPGSHKRYSPIFLIGNFDGKLGNNLELMDVGPLILDILKIQRSFDFDKNNFKF